MNILALWVIAAAAALSLWARWHRPRYCRCGMLPMPPEVDIHVRMPSALCTEWHSLEHCEAVENG